jgi:hypothetical protein
MKNLDIKPGKPILKNQDSSDIGKKINNTFNSSAKSNNIDLKIENDDVLEYYDEGVTIGETDSGSSGAFSAPLGMVKRTFDESVILKSNDIFNIIKESIKESEVLDETETTSSGQYITPAVWSKNPKKSKFSKKPFFKGGKFVEVKEKCKKFPYCNQSIDAVKLSENTLKNIKIIAEKYDLSEKEIKKIVNQKMKEKSKIFINDLKKK